MTFLRFITIILLTGLLTGCSEHSENPRSLIVNKEAFESQLSDTAPPVRISPDNATIQTTIHLTADNSVINNGVISWYINGVKAAAENGLRFSSSELRKGDIVQAVIVNSGGEFRSNEITIRNTPPALQDVHLTPEVPKVGSVFQVKTNATDVNNDSLSYTFKWSLNGVFAGEEDYLEADLKRGDEIEVIITPFDGEEYGNSLILKSTVRNSLPVFTDSSPSFKGDTYEYQLTATDPDGDTLEYTLIESPEGMAIDPSNGMITWKVGKDQEGVYDIKASIKDNNGGELIVPFTTRIGFAQNEG